MNGRCVSLIFEKNLFHDEVLGGYVLLPFAIEDEFNLAASEDIIVLSGACVINSMSTATPETTTDLCNVPEHDICPPNIFKSIVVLYLSAVPISVVDCIGRNPVMLRCDIGDDGSFLGELAENSTSTYNSLMMVYPVANAGHVLHDSRPACYH